MIKAVITDRGAVFDLAPQCGSVKGEWVSCPDFMFCFLFDFHFVLSISAYYFATERRAAQWIRVRIDSVRARFGSGYKMILGTSVCVCFPYFSRNKNTLTTAGNTLISFKNKIDEIIVAGGANISPARSENRIWWMTTEEVVASHVC